MYFLRAKKEPFAKNPQNSKCVKTVNGEDAYCLYYIYTCIVAFSMTY